MLINVPVGSRKDLESAPFSAIIADAQAQLSTGRLVVRFSGTEPLLRVMVEASTEDHAHTVAQTVATTLEKTLRELL